MGNHQDKGDHIRTKVNLKLTVEQIHCVELGKWKKSLQYFMCGTRKDKVTCIIIIWNKKV